MTKTSSATESSPKNKDAESETVIRQQKVVVWENQLERQTDDCIAVEIPVALVYNGVSHAVMMASPNDLHAFALGFSLSEGILRNSDELYDCSVEYVEEGVQVLLEISSQCLAELKERRRNLLGRTGCGLCGSESLEQIRLPLGKVTTDFSVTHFAIDRATRALENHQPLQSTTGAFHAAAWCNKDGDIQEIAEDVGRHNALDKLIGKLALGQRLSENMQGFLLVSSRASYEIVQKSAMAKIGVIAAVSAPTSMAVKTAEEIGMTLVGFSRSNRHVAYTHVERLVG